MATNQPHERARRLESLLEGSLVLSGLPTRDLFVLYQGWLDRTAALEAASITGAFALPDTAERAAALRDKGEL